MRFRSKRPKIDGEGVRGPSRLQIGGLCLLALRPSPLVITYLLPPPTSELCRLRLDKRSSSCLN